MNQNIARAVDRGRGTGEQQRGVDLVGRDQRLRRYGDVAGIGAVVRIGEADPRRRAEVGPSVAGNDHGHRSAGCSRSRRYHDHGPKRIDGDCRPGERRDDRRSAGRRVRHRHRARARGAGKDRAGSEDDINQAGGVGGDHTRGAACGGGIVAGRGQREGLRFGFVIGKRDGLGGADGADRLRGERQTRWRNGQWIGADAGKIGHLRAGQCIVVHLELAVTDAADAGIEFHRDSAGRSWGNPCSANRAGRR